MEKKRRFFIYVIVVVFVIMGYKDDSAVVKADSRFEIGGYTYEVNTTNKTATIVSENNRATGIAHIIKNVPGEVEYNGVKYQVTKVMVDSIDMYYMSIVFGEGIKELNGFESYAINQEIYFPSTLQRFSNTKEIRCDFDSLRTIKVAQGNPIFYVKDGMLINKVKHEVMWAPLAAGSVKIPDEITLIGKNAFKRNSKVTSISFGPKLTSFGEDAFYSCDKLLKLTLPEGLKTLLVDPGFSGMKIQTLTIPKNLMEIDPSIFNGMTNLKSLKISADNKYFKISKGLLLSKDGKELVCPIVRKAKVVIPKNITKIRKGAFSRTRGIDQVVIKGKVKQLPKNCFAYSDLVKIKLPSSVTKVSDYAFFQCSYLDKVTLPGKLKSIGKHVFEQSGIRILTIPASVKKIEKDALQFDNPINLTELVFKGKTPPSIYKNNPKNDGDGDFFWIGKIQVPKKSMAKYKKAFKLFRYNKMIGK